MSEVYSALPAKSVRRLWPWLAFRLRQGTSSTSQGA